MKGKIEMLGKEAQEKAMKMSIEGLPYSTIAEQLSKEYNDNISPQNVQDFLKRKKNKTLQFLKDDRKFQRKMSEQYFNTVEQLSNLNSELWKFFYDLLKNPDKKVKTILVWCKDCEKNIKAEVEVDNYANLLKTAEIILKQIEHVDKVLGKLKSKSFNISYNFVDLSKKISLIVPKLLNDLEKRRIIKINKKRLKVYVDKKPKKEEFDDDEEEE